MPQLFTGGARQPHRLHHATRLIRVHAKGHDSTYIDLITVYRILCPALSYRHAVADLAQ